MVATPFKGTVVTSHDRAGNRPGPTLRFSASDVANALVTFDDIGGTPSFFTPPPKGLYIQDILLSAAGVDTKALVWTKGTVTTDKVLRDAALVETLSVDAKSRCQGQKGAFLEGGVQYGLKQLT